MPMSGIACDKRVPIMITGTLNVISDEQRALSNVTSRHNVIYINR